jgi:hypothetical protein
VRCEYEGPPDGGMPGGRCTQEARYRVQYALCGLCGVVDALGFCADHTALMRRLEASLGIYCHCDEERSPLTPIEAVSLISA